MRAGAESPGLFPVIVIVIRWNRLSVIRTKRFRSRKEANEFLLSLQRDDAVETIDMEET